MLGADFIHPRARLTEQDDGLSSGVCLAGKQFVEECLLCGPVTRHDDLGLGILRRRPIHHNLAARAQLFGAEVDKRMSFAAAAQHDIFRTGNLHVMNHRRVLAAKPYRNLEIGRGLAPAILDKHAANEDDIGDFIRGQLRIGQKRDVVPCLPVIQRRNSRRNQDKRSQEPEPHRALF